MGETAVMSRLGAWARDQESRALARAAACHWQPAEGSRLLLGVAAQQVVQHSIDNLGRLALNELPEHVGGFEGQAIGMATISGKANNLSQENHPLGGGVV